jgi:predicted restriction endonuclease
MVINTNSDLIKGLKLFIKDYNFTTIAVSGVELDIRKKSGMYYSCIIDDTKYWIKFEEKKDGYLGKSFIHLLNNFDKNPSVVQLTVDKSNFYIEGDTFYIKQKRTATIGKKTEGFDSEFIYNMYINGFNRKNEIANGSCSNPDYYDIIKQIFHWLKIRVRVKSQLEAGYRIATSDQTESPVDSIDAKTRTEGGEQLIVSVRVERDAKLRKQAIIFHGTKCMACGFDFKAMYGIWGEHYIEVHHAIPLSDYLIRETNLETDLIVVCSNCHSMIHRKRNITLSITELKIKIKNK